MEWLDYNLSPRLRLDHADIELTYQAVSPDRGPGPEIVTFKAECVARHSVTGRLVYTADDLAFLPSVFADFARGLGSVLDGKSQEVRLSPIGDELVLTIRRADEGLRLLVQIREWQAIYPETTASVCGGVGTDTAYRWARELSRYADCLGEWLLQRE